MFLISESSSINFINGNQTLNENESFGDITYAYASDGTKYRVYVTFYSYKLAFSTTWLIVEPQATQVMQRTKTPEQMQQEAEQNGSLRIWNEFSWWFPWY